MNCRYLSIELFLVEITFRIRWLGTLTCQKAIINTYNCHYRQYPDVKELSITTDYKSDCFTVKVTGTDKTTLTGTPHQLSGANQLTLASLFVLSSKNVAVSHSAN